LKRLARFFLSALFFLSIVSPSTAAEVSDELFQSLKQKAAVAVEDWEPRIADFYLARYLGLAAKYPESNKSRQDVEELIRNRKLYPKAFLPGDFDAGFLKWFETGLDARWGSEDARVREKYRSIEVQSVIGKDNYFATVVMVPELESWFVAKVDQAPIPMTLVLGSASEKTLVFAGRHFQNVPPVRFPALVLKTQKHAVHYFWAPDFYDLDGDGKPELWLRYNLAWENGFTQVLGIYRMGDTGRPALIKEFRGENEGIARRLSNGEVEVATGMGSESSLPHMSYDRHRLALWRFEKGDFKKISEKTLPHLLKDPGWEKYYFD
jgi:hypothetical protein